MRKISLKNFIEELDSFFAKEDLQGAEKCLLRWLDLARECGDKSGELIVLNEMTGFYRQTKEEDNSENTDDSDVTETETEESTSDVDTSDKEEEETTETGDGEEDWGLGFLPF